MEKQTLGVKIATLRKSKGLTQLEIANYMNVTDKAVSKWERDISYPDINSIPKLAQILEVEVEELLNSDGISESLIKLKEDCVKNNEENNINKDNNKDIDNKPKDEIVEIVLKAIPLAMGVAVVVTSVLKEIDMYSGFIMLGIGLSATGLNAIKSIKKK